jgi:hypothetical protein
MAVDAERLPSAFDSIGQTGALVQTREGSGRRRCGRDGWFALERPPAAGDVALPQ